MKIEEVLEAAKNKSPHPSRDRSFVIWPPVSLIHKRTKIRVEVDAVDVRGPSPHTIHIKQYDLWLGVNDYELAPPVTPVQPDVA